MCTYYRQWSLLPLGEQAYLLIASFLEVVIRRRTVAGRLLLFVWYSVLHLKTSEALLWTLEDGSLSVVGS